MLHAIGFAPESCLGGGFLTAPWDDVAIALQVSAYSLKALAVACRPLMTSGGSIVGLDFDNSRVAWPVYDWMGVAKAAFESTARYLARDLGAEGIRVNLVAAGPIRTIAARSIPGFEQFEDAWDAARAARLERQRPRARRRRVRRPVLRPVPRDHRRGHPRRRRLPRHRRLRPANAQQLEPALSVGIDMRCHWSRTVRYACRGDHDPRDDGTRFGTTAGRRGGRGMQHRGRAGRGSSSFTASCRRACPTPGEAELVGDRDGDEALLERRARRLGRVQHEPAELAAAAHHGHFDAAGRQQEVAPRDEPRVLRARPGCRAAGARARNARPGTRTRRDRTDR